MLWSCASKVFKKISAAAATPPVMSSSRKCGEWDRQDDVGKSAVRPSLQVGVTPNFARGDFYDEHHGLAPGGYRQCVTSTLAIPSLSCLSQPQYARIPHGVWRLFAAKQDRHFQLTTFQPNFRGGYQSRQVSSAECLDDCMEEWSFATTASSWQAPWRGGSQMRTLQISRT